MKARTTALASLVLGGAVGYCQKPIVEPPRPPNPQIMRIAEDLRKRGFREEFEHNSWWLNWHRQYMYSRTISAQAQASFVDPETGVTEKYYSIIPELQNHLIWVLPTVLDEGLGNVAFRTLPNHVGVTGTLEIGPFKSTEVGGTPTEEKILVLKASVPEGSGRKSICSGELSWYGSNDVLTTGKVIMIEPWWGHPPATTMFDKLNPFKKSAKTEQESGNIQPTKSTASVADSIKSLGDKTAQKMSDAPKPPTPFDRSRASNANMDNSGLGSGGLAPISSAGIR